MTFSQIRMLSYLCIKDGTKRWRSDKADYGCKIQCETLYIIQAKMIYNDKKI